MREETDPDVDWVARLAGVPVGRARTAVGEARDERRLFAHLHREHESERREHYVEIDAPLELYALVRLRRPRHVVEVGVSSGVSSAYLLQALARNRLGTLHSVDLPQRQRPVRPGSRPPTGSWSLPPGRESGWAVPMPLRVRWDLRLGDKADALPLLAEELPRIDLFVYDVPHRDEETWREFQLLDPLMPTGGVAIADHGPGGDLCSALARWARRRRAEPVRRAELGLYGFRCASGPQRSRRTPSRTPRAVPRPRPAAT
jgi:hypothetical protein